MDAAGVVWVCLLSACLCVRGVRGVIGTSAVNCVSGSSISVGTVDEGYEGDVERLTGIPAGTGVTLVKNLFPEHLQYLELSFTLGETVAVVRTTKKLDADALEPAGTLYYSVMCESGRKLNNTRTLTLNDLNDNWPVFTERLYTMTVSETLAVESEVLRVEAVDADSTIANSRVTYSAVAPTSPDFIVTNAGAFILKRRLNYNAARNYNYTVEATDPGGLSDRTTVIFNVEDFDNLNPYFDHSLYRASIPENETGPFHSVLPEAIQAQDGDTGINTPVVYSISTVSPGKYLGNFIISADSGLISLQTAIDREEADSSMIMINIKATQADDATKGSEAVVSVTLEDVNDNAPEFDRPAGYSVLLLENSPVHAVLLRAAVSDADQGGFVGSLLILPESSPFSIGSDGTVSVKNPAALDRETTESFLFQIEAKETDSPNRVVTADVNVTLLDENDNSPVFQRDKYDVDVFKNQTEGMLLTQVVAEDADAGLNGRVKYSIDFGNHDGFFSVDENTGEIVLERTIPMEENRILEFRLLVTARDGGVVSRSSSVQVDISAPGDSKPQFTQKTYRGSIEEEQAPGVVIVKVSFIAVDPVVPVTLRVVTEGDKFSISHDGVITSRVTLDYDEAPRNYSVTISISDNNSTDTAIVEVQVTDVNDNSPVFAPPADSIVEVVPEDAETGSNITAALVATDKDDGFNGEIRYSLQGGGGDGRFSVDPRSGLVSLAGALDRETEAEYSLLVVAHDQGRPARSATAVLLVRVSDVNDNVPAFSEPQYEVDVGETEAVGVTLLTVSAVDPDEGTNGEVAYGIVAQNPPSTGDAVFQLDPSSGALRLAGPLDYSAAAGYRLVVRASDGGTPPLVANVSVVVRVTDVNNNPPRFSRDSYDVAVAENLPSGASVATLEVTDRDQGGFSDGHFVFTSDTFDISRRGVVSLKSDVTLDRETRDRYLLQVVAVDQPVGGLNSTAQLNITVLDYNDNVPQFLPLLPDPVQVPEGDYSEEAPWEVCRVLATDADLGDNGAVTVSLLAAHALFRFREDGTLLAVGRLDREAEDAYDLVLIAADGGSPQRQNITELRVSVTDMNDNAPEFSSDTYSRSLLVRDAEEGDLVLTLSAADRDTGDNSLITYSFSVGRTPYLALDSDTGMVTLASHLDDITEDTVIELTATAKDHGLPALNTTAVVVVTLRMLSLLEGVVFQSSSYNFSLPENAAAGAAVGAVAASSGSPLHHVTYALTTHADLFSVDALGGALATRKALDREAQEWYILEVVAVDTRVPPTSAVALVRVQVQDVNEKPEFARETYKAKVFSIAPYRSPVIQVKATDPDAGDSGELLYSVSPSDSVHFDVDGSTGQVFVVSAGALAGGVASVEVRATDPRGLHDTTTVEVEVQGSVSSSDVVVLSLNRAANVVDKKVPEMEESLGTALGWTVSVIGVSSSGGSAPSARSSSRAAVMKTLVSLVAIDGAAAVPSEELTAKLRSESVTVKAALEKVFGAGLQHEVEEGPASPASNQAVVITLGVLLTLSMLALVLMVTHSVVKLRRPKRHAADSYRDSFDFSGHNEAYANTEKTKTCEMSEQGRRSLSSRREPECDQQRGGGGDTETEDKDSLSGTSGDSGHKTAGRDHGSRPLGGDDDKGTEGDDDKGTERDDDKGTERDDDKGTERDDDKGTERDGDKGTERRDSEGDGVESQTYAL